MRGKDLQALIFNKLYDGSVIHHSDELSEPNNQRREVGCFFANPTKKPMGEANVPSFVKTIAVLAIYLLPLIADVRAEDIDVNFIAGTLDGKKWGSLNIDTVTELLGKPGKTRAAKVLKYGIKAGACLSYETERLSFYFEHPLVNSNQALSALFISLVPVVTKDFDDGSEQRLSAFRGVMTRDVNADWKIRKFLEVFKDYGAVDKADRATLVEKNAEYAKEIERVEQFDKQHPDRKGSLDDVKEMYEQLIEDLKDSYRAEIPVTPWTVKIYYDPTTEFLTRIVVSRRVKLG